MKGSTVAKSSNWSHLSRNRWRWWSPPITSQQQLLGNFQMIFGVVIFTWRIGHIMGENWSANVLPPPPPFHFSKMCAPITFVFLLPDLLHQALVNIFLIMSSCPHGICNYLTCTTGFRQGNKMNDFNNHLSRDAQETPKTLHGVVLMTTRNL